MSSNEPTIADLNDFTPLTRRKKEPQILIDTSGSMASRIAGTQLTRRGVLGEAISLLIAGMEGDDAQAAAENADRQDGDGGKRKGGVMAAGFADTATEFGDWNSENVRDEWAKIQWGGGTSIATGWALLDELYMEEFEEESVTDRPVAFRLIATDGETDDFDRFAKILAKPGSDTYAVIAVLGNHDDPAHISLVQRYRDAAGPTNKHIRVVSFGSVTDPQEICDGLRSLAA